MTGPEKPLAPFSLARWSRRKHAAARADVGRDVAPPSAQEDTAREAPPRPATASGPETAPAAPTAIPQPAPLPAIESLTLDSDFAAFLRPEVDPSLTRQALRKLFSDPHFNVMDGLDTYIDDYTKTVPITPDMLARLEHARRVLNPPKTRVNEQGYVEDVPDEPEGNAPEAGAPAGLTAPADPASASASGGGPADSSPGLAGAMASPESARSRDGAIAADPQADAAAAPSKSGPRQSAESSTA